MPIYGKGNINKDHSFTDFPITISNNVKSSVSNWSVEGNGVQASTKTYSLTEQPPINFNADGNSITSWSMKGNGSQTGTPTPSVPIMPEFVGVRTGNLVPQPYYSSGGLIDGVTWVVGTNYSLKATGETTKGTNFYLRNGDFKLSAGTYVLKITGKHTGFTLILRDKDAATNITTISSSSGDVYKSFTLETSTGVCSLYFNNSNTGVTVDLDCYVMLNLGSSALPYEPYGYKIPITCAGQTIPVYLGQTQTVRRVKKLVLTGTETGWFKNVQTTSDAYYNTSITPTYYRTDGYCSHLETVSNSQATSGIFYGGAVNLLMPLSLGLDTISKFTAYLAQQYAAGTPVTVWYVLATPTTGIINEPLCKIGDYADKLLSTSQGTPQLTLSTEESNLISFETNLQPSKFNIKYYEEGYAKIKDIQMQIPTAKTFNYTEYPITISNAVSSNCNIDLFGNGIQNGTPTPDNPIMPEFVGVRTRNLIEFKNKTQKVHNVDITIQNGELSFDGTANDNGGRLFQVSEDIVLESGTYRLSHIKNGTTPDYFLQSKSDSTKYYLEGQEFTLTSKGTFYISFNFVKDRVYSGNTTIMLNSGSTALPYEPYGYKIPLTCAEQTVPVYLGQVSTVRRISKIVLTGTESGFQEWKKSSTYQGSFYAKVLGNMGAPKTVICSHAEYTATISAQSYVYGKCCVDGTNPDRNLNLFIGEANWTVNDFRSYLASEYAAGHPVTIWYVLATERTAIVNEPLCKIGDYSDELQTTIQLEPFNQNTISIDTQLQPSKVSLTYKTKESTDPYNSIKYVLDNNNNYLYESSLG